MLANPADAAGVARLCLWAAALPVLAYGWQLDMPLNKKIWTPAMSCSAPRWPAGADGQGTTLWTTPLSGLQQSVFLPLAADPRLGSLLYALANLLFYAAIAAWRDRRGLFVRV